KKRADALARQGFVVRDDSAQGHNHAVPGFGSAGAPSRRHGTSILTTTPLSEPGCMAMRWRSPYNASRRDRRLDNPSPPPATLPLSSTLEFGVAAVPDAPARPTPSS